MQRDKAIKKRTTGIKGPSTPGRWVTYRFSSSLSLLRLGGILRQDLDLDLAIGGRASRTDRAFVYGFGFRRELVHCHVIVVQDGGLDHGDHLMLVMRGDIFNRPDAASLCLSIPPLPAEDWKSLRADAVCYKRRGVECIESDPSQAAESKGNFPSGVDSH